MAAEPRAFSHRVEERVLAARPAPQGFFHRLPPDVQAELLDLRRRFRAGEFQSAAALARGIVEECRQDGLDICGVQGVSAWLARPD